MSYPYWIVIGLWLMSCVHANVVFETVRRTHTHPPVIITLTARGQAIKNTVEHTNYVTHTIYQAKSVPNFVAKGSIVTKISTKAEPPVTQHSEYPTTALSKTLVPETYSTPVTVNLQPEITASTVIHHQHQTVSQTEEGSSLGPASSNAPSSVGTTMSIAYGHSLQKTASQTEEGSSLGQASSNAPSSVGTTLSLAKSNSLQTEATTSSKPSPSPSPTKASINNYANAYSYSNVPDILATLSGNLPASVFPHSAVPIPLPSNLSKDGPLQTNKFYDNLFLGDQTETVFALPYRLWYSTAATYYGWAMEYAPASQRVSLPFFILLLFSIY